MLEKSAGTVLKALLVAGLAFGAASAAQAKEWRAWNIHVEGYPNTVAMDKFAELVKEKTGGSLEITNYHGGVLGNQPDAIEQVRIGALEVGNFNLGPMGTVVPATNVVSLPFIFKDLDHMHRVLGAAPGETIRKGMEEKGLVPLAWYDSGARSFYNSKKAITQPSDVAGMKIRVMNNELFTGMVGALGGDGSPMAFSEVYQALKTGVVDGAENNWPSFESTGHFEVAGYYSVTQHLMIPECVCISKTAWDALSDAEKKAVTEAAVESAALQRELWAERAEASRKKVLEAGVKYNEVTDKSAFQAAMKPVYDKYIAANPEHGPLIAEMQAVK